MQTDTRTASNCKATQVKTQKRLLDKWTFINRINGDPKLTPTAKLVASYLMWRMNCKWETCFPSRETVAADLHLSIRTIHDAIKALKDDGWLTWQRRKDTSSVYSFVWDRASADTQSYVARDEHPQQEPETAKTAVSETAKSAHRTTGTDLTREDPELLTASPTEAREQPIEKVPPSAEKEPPSDDDADDTEWLALQAEHRKHTSVRPEVEVVHTKHGTIEHRLAPRPTRTVQIERQPVQPQQASEQLTPEQWKDRVWKTTGGEFKKRFYATTSESAFKKRLGGMLKRNNFDYRRVDALMLATLKAGPALDAWEYMAGIMRKGMKSGEIEFVDEFAPNRVHDYSKPALDDAIM